MVWGGAEDAPIEEETQRLMLHLSIEPPERFPGRTEPPRPRKKPRGRSLLRRLLGRAAGREYG